MGRRNRWTVSSTGFRKNIIMNKFILVIFAFGFSQIHADGDMGMHSDSTTVPSSTESNGYGEDDGYGSDSGYGDGYGSGYGEDGYGSGYEDGEDYEECCPRKYVESSWDINASGWYVYWGRSDKVPWFCNSQCVYVKEEDYDGGDLDGYGSGSGYGSGYGYGDKKKSRKTRGAGGPKVQKYCFKPSDTTRAKCYYDYDDGLGGFGSGYGSGYGSDDGYGSGSGYGDGYGTTEGTTGPTEGTTMESHS